MTEMTGAQRRARLLDQVRACVCRDRMTTHGDAEDNFAAIAQIASVVLAKKLKAPLDAVDVALFSAALKLGRLAANTEHADNWIDLAGYAVCGGGIAEKDVEARERMRAFLEDPKAAQPPRTGETV